MDWFERLTGFPEADYAGTQAALQTDGEFLVCRRTGRRSAMGRLELVSLDALRTRAAAATSIAAPTQFDTVTGDIRALHRDPAFASALFQVASQFNLLEMPGPSVTPEHGVTGYQHDRTQGPACAIAAGAATIYGNYLVPMTKEGGRAGVGQTAHRQIDALADLRTRLASALQLPPAALWTSRNGYTEFERANLPVIADYLSSLDEVGRDGLRASLMIGLHWDVEVTDCNPGPRVSQAFCSALPLGSYAFQSDHWQPLASLILEAAYEATLLATILNAERGMSNIVLLTRLGGGAFANAPEWIDAAITRATALARNRGLRAMMVRYG